MNKEIEILNYTIDELKECKSVLQKNELEIHNILNCYEDLQLDINSMTKGKTKLPDRYDEFPKMFVKDFLMVHSSYNLILDTIKSPKVKDCDWVSEVEIALEFEDCSAIDDFINKIDELIKSLEYDL